MIKYEQFCDHDIDFVNYLAFFFFFTLFTFSWFVKKNFFKFYYFFAFFDCLYSFSLIHSFFSFILHSALCFDLGLKYDI